MQMHGMQELGAADVRIEEVCKLGAAQCDCVCSLANFVGQRQVDVRLLQQHLQRLLRVLLRVSRRQVQGRQLPVRLRIDIRSSRK